GVHVQSLVQDVEVQVSPSGVSRAAYQADHVARPDHVAWPEHHRGVAQVPVLGGPAVAVVDNDAVAEPTTAGTGGPVWDLVSDGDDRAAGGRVDRDTRVLFREIGETEVDAFVVVIGVPAGLVVPDQARVGRFLPVAEGVDVHVS